MPYTMKFMVMVWAAFLARVKPVSTSAKPACMNITRNPATRVHTKLMATVLAAAAAFAARASESVASPTDWAATAAGHASASSTPRPSGRFMVDLTVTRFVQKMQDYSDRAQLPIRVGMQLVILPLQFMHIYDDTVRSTGRRLFESDGARGEAGVSAPRSLPEEPERDQHGDEDPRADPP